MSRDLWEQPVAGRITPFEVHVPQGELDDLRERLARTRWIDEFPGSGWSYGTSRLYLQELCAYWRTGFDWRGVGGPADTVWAGGRGVERGRPHARPATCRPC